jgi:hypothetical protein
MNKLSSPFKDGAIRITQTTHNHLGGHTDFTMVRAIDCNREPFDNNIYAEGEGIVIASVNATNPSSYLHIHYAGLPGHIIRELVHVRPVVAKGARVTRGQLVGTLEPYRANFYGAGKNHSVHLHWSFLNTNKTGAPNPFNYLDRSTAVTTNAAVIKNSRTWFNADGSFNWSSFGDYKLEIQAPTPPPPTPPTCEAERAQIEALQVQIQGLKNDITVREKAIVEKNDTINAQKAQLAMKDSELTKEKEKYQTQVENTEIVIRTYLEALKKKDNEIEFLKEEVEKYKDLSIEKITFKDMIIRIGMYLGIGIRSGE